MADDTFASLTHGSSPKSPPEAMTTAGNACMDLQPSQCTQRQLALAEDFIRKNICNAISISDIADAAGINVRALQRLFRKHHGVAPIQILLNRRIAAAHEIIGRGHVTSVRDLASEASFLQSGPVLKTLPPDLLGSPIRKDPRTSAWPQGLVTGGNTRAFPQDQERCQPLMCWWPVRFSQAAIQ